MLPTYKEYLALARDFPVVPVWVELPLEGMTPLAVLRKLGRQAVYLLESAEGTTFSGRYSFIGYDPWVVLTFYGETGQIVSNGRVQRFHGPPLSVLENFLRRWSAPQIEGLPRFYGGAVGYLGYDLVRHLERLPSLARKNTKQPDVQLVVTRCTLVFDHLKQTLFPVILTQPQRHNPAESFSGAQSYLGTLIARLAAGQPPQEDGLPLSIKDGSPLPSLSRDEFLKCVAQAKDFITAGEILQVVLSVRWRVPCSGQPLVTYERLRTVNPSPYMFYLNFGNMAVVGSSPEMLVRVEDGEVITHPIAGTRPRGTTPQEDEALAAELLADTKERAEHVMLVDLARNDLGRVCQAGSVRVTRFMTCEKYSHVMHLVSEVRGRLPADRSPIEVFAACFPAGTVTGAPKVRAMEIIEALEPIRRGIYAGAVGYFSFTGNLDTCIAIRCLTVDRDQLFIQAGAGIVADSVPEREYEEICHKAKVMFSILGGGETLCF